MFKEEADVVHPDSDVSIHLYKYYYTITSAYVLHFQLLYSYLANALYVPQHINSQGDSVDSAHEVAEKDEKVKQQFPDLSVDSFPTIH